MKIVRNRENENVFTWEGLTLGRLMALEAALQHEQKVGALGTNGHDLLYFLQHRKLVMIDSFHGAAGQEL